MLGTLRRARVQRRNRRRGENSSTRSDAPLVWRRAATVVQGRRFRPPSLRCVARHVAHYRGSELPAMAEIRLLALSPAFSDARRRHLRGPNQVEGPCMLPALRDRRFLAIKRIALSRYASAPLRATPCCSGWASRMRPRLSRCRFATLRCANNGGRQSKRSRAPLSS